MRRLPLSLALVAITAASPAIAQLPIVGRPDYGPPLPRPDIGPPAMLPPGPNAGRVRNFADRQLSSIRRDIDRARRSGQLSRSEASNLYREARQIEESSRSRDTLRLSEVRGRTERLRESVARAASPAPSALPEPAEGH